MPTETANAKAAEIRRMFVDHFMANVYPSLPNKVRAMNECVNRLVEKLSHEGIVDRNLFPMPATIGDIDPWEIGFNSKREFDPFEEKYRDLPGRLGLDAESPNYLRFQEKDREIRMNYKNAGVALTRYNGEGGKGTPEVRSIVAREAEQIGLDAGPDDVWMGYGGGDLLERAARSINVNRMNRFGHQATLLTPSTGFSMAVEAIKDDGVKVQYLDNSDLPRNELTAERLDRYFEEGGMNPDMVLLTPANNPNAELYEPDTLREFINKMTEKSPETIYIFDMAYMWMIDRTKAINIMQVIHETGADQKAMFVNSLSKKAARPGSRIGSIVIPNKELGAIFHRDNMRHVATWSGDLDVLYQTIDALVDDRDYRDLAEVLTQRQQAMIDVLSDLDPGHKYFKNLDAAGRDVPLYLWIELQDGITAFDVLKDLNIGANPSEVFGPDDGFGVVRNHIRLSTGFLSTQDILLRSPSTLKKWSTVL